MLGVRIGQVCKSADILLLNQTDIIPTTTKKSTRDQLNEEACILLYITSVMNLPKAKSTSFLFTMPTIPFQLPVESIAPHAKSGGLTMVVVKLRHSWRYSSILIMMPEYFV